MIVITYITTLFKYIKDMSDTLGLPLYKAYGAFIDTLQNKRVRDCIMREYCINENLNVRGCK